MKSEECKKQFLLGELLFLGGSNSSYSARLQPAYFVFPSQTQKAADENRSSQKPPAAWICARTFGKWYMRETALIGKALNAPVIRPEREQKRRIIARSQKPYSPLN
jgi:hypothetical protein